MMEWKRQGILCLVSGPTGSGKTTLCRRFAREREDCVYSISCTTRPPREGEENGIDYHFLSREEFEERIEAGELLEYAEVHGRYYGTLKGPVVENLEKGVDVLMDLDVQGAAQLRGFPDEFIQRSLVDVFVLLASREEIVARLEGRGKMDPEERELRLKNAEEEMRQWPKYRYAFASGTKDEDFARFSAIIEAERCRAERLLMG